MSTTESVVIINGETGMNKHMLKDAARIYITVANTMDNAETLTFKEIFLRYVNILKNEGSAPLNIDNSIEEASYILDQMQVTIPRPSDTRIISLDILESIQTPTPRPNNMEIEN